MDEMQTLRSRFRFWLGLFMAGLVLAGLSAVLLPWETAVLARLFGLGTLTERVFPDVALWVSKVHAGVTQVSIQQPYMLYGTDWLAFGHWVIAAAFLGPLIEPVRNKWVIDFGIIACAAVVPMALVFGPIREIPFFWQMVDCAFGAVGVVPLLICRSLIGKMERAAKMPAA